MGGTGFRDRKVTMMRRILVLATTLFLVANAATAAEWRLGVQAGANSSGLSGDVPSGVSVGKHSGMVAGMIGEMRLAEDVWLSVQPMYLQRGTTTQLAVAGEAEKIEGPSLAMNYFAVPILARVVSNSGRTYVMGGFNPAFLMDAEMDDGTLTEDVSSAVNSFALAADIGFGVLVPVGGSILSFEARYEQSILNLAADDRQEADDVLPVRFRSTGFQFMAGLMWPLGGK